jgi:hypothetical protein
MDTNLAMLRNLDGAAGGRGDGPASRDAAAGHQGLRRPRPRPHPNPGRERAPRGRPRELLLAAGGLPAGPGAGARVRLDHLPTADHRRRRLGRGDEPLLPIAIYAAVRRELGQTFAYRAARRRSWSWSTAAAGPGLRLGGARARGGRETFNVTNGDVFAGPRCGRRWPTPSAWSRADEPRRCALAARTRPVWEAVVAARGLRPIRSSACWARATTTSTPCSGRASRRSACRSSSAR